MSEMTAGLRALEMHERQVFYRDRAQKEHTDRKRVFRRVVNRPA